MSDLPSAKLLKDCLNEAYYDYVGRVEVRSNKHIEVSNYVVIVDRKTGNDLCEIDISHGGEFLKYDGKVISFRGKYNKASQLVTPHNK